MSGICLFKVFDKKDYGKVTFEITSKCNLFCKHCCTNSDFKGGYSLEKNNIKNFLLDLKINGISDLYITGGEPFLYPYIDEFLKKVKDIGFNISIATNAMILNDEQIYFLKYDLYDLNLDKGDFAFEFSVRGWALKNTGNYLEYNEVLF